MGEIAASQGSFETGKLWLANNAFHLDQASVGSKTRCFRINDYRIQLKRLSHQEVMDYINHLGVFFLYSR